MKLYMPPQQREAARERFTIRAHVRQYVEERGAEVISRPGGGRSLAWLRRAGGLLLETNAVSEADEAECFYMAEELGRQVLVLYDVQNGVPGGRPSERLIAASRRDGAESSNLWVVQHSPLTIEGAPYAIVDSALDIFTRVDLNLLGPELSQPQAF